MKVKSFYALSSRQLDKRINVFLEDSQIDVEDIKFSATLFYVAAMVVYRNR
ncbi:hypothetical protein ACFO4L_11140 [Bacillus daqingensis]|uniref:Uncharacterized protein n=1 Tax=Bacillus daqingensis TaxID=872396 RepID=A0ABV9NUR8_9BACI